MNRVEVFDPPMCCSTGVCGPNVDLALVTFAADLHWLANQRIAIERYNLAQQPQGRRLQRGRYAAADGRHVRDHPVHDELQRQRAPPQVQVPRRAAVRMREAAVRVADAE